MKQKILNHKIDQRVSTKSTSVLKIVEHVYVKANLIDEEQLNSRLQKSTGKSWLHYCFSGRTVPMTILDLILFRVCINSPVSIHFVLANAFYQTQAHRCPAHPKTRDFDFPSCYRGNNCGESKCQLQFSILICSIVRFCFFQHCQFYSV